MGKQNRLFWQIVSPKFSNVMGLEIGNEINATFWMAHGDAHVKSS